jgi:hypothetical protein
MKNTHPFLPVLLGATVLGALAACASAPPGNPELSGRGSMWAGDAIRNASLNNAIIAQHTLYPYHFANGSAQLNDLGQRDLNVLANHFRDTPGDLNVRRGDATETLYEARVKSVLDRLTVAGVAGGSVAVRDGLPGGEGIASERVIVILKEKMTKTGSGISGSSSSGSNGSTGLGTGNQ